MLDIGCASGLQVFALAPYCEKVVGVDIAQSFIDECHRQRQAQGVGNVSFRVAHVPTIYPTKASTSSFAVRSWSTSPNWTGSVPLPVEIRMA